MHLDRRVLHCRRLMTNLDHNGKTDILLVADNPSETALVLKVLKKAKIVNRIHVLAQGREILDFLFRLGPYKETPGLPAETLILLSISLRSPSKRCSNVPA